MNSDVDDFAGRRGAAVVTGGNGAIGSAICRLLVARGSNVAATYKSSSANLDDVVTSASARGRDVVTWQLDLTDASAVGAFVDQVIDRFGAVHTLVHAAGPHVAQTFLSKLDPERLQSSLVQEVGGFFNVVKPLLQALRDESGAIVAVTTIATRRFPLRDGLSAGPKAAIEGLVRALAAEEGRYGVRANCVGPGILHDGMARRLAATGEVTPEDLEFARTRIPLRRFGTAEDVAEAVCFLASSRARYISGQTLDVDGGYTV